MNFCDLWRMLRAGWWLLLTGLVVGIFAAGLYLATTPKQYEASLLVKVGRVAYPDAVKQIEAAGYVVRQLKMPSFQKAVLASLGWNGETRERLFTATFQVTSPANAHVKIRLRSSTPDDAGRAVEAIFARLEASHRALIKKVVSNNEKELASIVSEIADTEAVLNRLERLLGKETPQSDLQGVLMWLQIKEWLQLTQAQKERLRTLRRREIAIREALNPELTVPTALVEPVVVSDRPVLPKARRVWVLAGIGGVLLGIFLVALRSLVDMRREERSQAAGCRPGDKTEQHSADITGI